MSRSLCLHRALANSVITKDKTVAEVAAVFFFVRMHTVAKRVCRQKHIRRMKNELNRVQIKTKDSEKERRRITDGLPYRYGKFWKISVLLFAAGMCVIAASTGLTTQITDSRAVEGQQEEPGKLALTFDDGPSEYTLDLSRGLKERGVQATFFLLGENMDGHRKEVEQLVEDGHLLGNHSYHHVQLDRISLEEARDEVEETNRRMEEWIGIRPIYVRPPYGSWSRELEKSIEMIPVFWNVDSLDWKLQDKDRIVAYVMEQVEDGDIILMHDGYKSSVEAAFALTDRLQKEGFVFTTAEKMLLE